MDELNGALRTDPIVAIATPPGRSAVAMLRFSGDGMRRLLLPVLKPFFKTSFAATRMVHCQLRCPQSQVTIDDVMVVFFDRPASYTGEDTCEIFTHGGPYIVERALGLFVALGFRIAEPGEFTRRAFIHGKIDLTRAEGIAALTSAVTKQQWQAGRSLADGRLEHYTRQLRQHLVEAMALLEAKIDFPDEQETSQVELAQVRGIATQVNAGLKRLMASYRSGRLARQGLRVALVGAPNAGKSTLLNTLIDSDRAIVTAVAGTTRDYIEEQYNLDGRLICIIDTAGIRNTSEQVEEMGIKRSLEMAESADIILCLTAFGIKPEFELKSTEGQAIWFIATKIDALASKEDLQYQGPRIDQSHLRHRISSHTGEGIEALKSDLSRYVDQKVATLDFDQGAFITNSRHLAACERASLALNKLFDGLDRGDFEECLAFELHEASHSLKDILGHIDNEDVLDVIFSQFCVGK